MGIELENKTLDSAPAPMKKDNEEIPVFGVPMKDKLLVAGYSIGLLALAAFMFYAWIKMVG